LFSSLHSLQAVPDSDGYTYAVLQQDGSKLPAALGHDSQAVDDQAMDMDADAADMDADATDDAAAAEGAGGVGDSWQGAGSGNMRMQHQQQEQQISQMMTGLSMGGGGKGGAAAAGARAVNASVLGKEMHEGERRCCICLACCCLPTVARRIWLSMCAVG
jgi:hypothetical protein